MILFVVSKYTQRRCPCPGDLPLHKMLSLNFTTKLFLYTKTAYIDTVCAIIHARISCRLYYYIYYYHREIVLAKRNFFRESRRRCRRIYS